jgi:hypothetical protein
MFHKIVFSIFIILALNSNSTFPRQETQEKIQPGTACELKGVAKIFIDPKMEPADLTALRNALRVGLPELKIVSKPEESDIHLRFGLEHHFGPEGRPRATPVGSAVKIIGPSEVKQLLCLKDWRIRYDVDHPPILLFAKYFITEYQRANSRSGCER